MLRAKVLERLSQLPGIRRRRVQIWAVAVISIVAVLGFKAAFPNAGLGTGLEDRLGAGVVLAVFLAALVCEYVDSSLGMGYGTTLTPLLLLAGFEPLQIVPCVLLSELVTGVLAAVMHHHDGNVDLLRPGIARRTAILLSTLSAVGAVAAVSFALQLPKFWLTAIIAVIILSVGVMTLATVRRQLRYRRKHIILLGAVAAFNKGLSGGGYGPLVTAGQVVSGISPKQAIGITSLAEALTCAVGLAAYVALKGHVDWLLAAPLCFGAMLSVPVSTLTVRRLPETMIRGAVGTVTCLLGLFTLVKLVF